jgi:RNA polymerase sigma-70 factor, ECF subfamily
MAQSATRPSTPTDHDWFADQVSIMLPSLYGTAARLCGNRTDAEDLVAESVAKAWEGLPSLRSRQVFRGWLFRILNNTYISQYRAQRSRGDVEPLDDSIDQFSLFERLHPPVLLWWGNPEQDFLNGLLREDLARAIDQLPDALRTVVVLVDVQAMSYQDAADALAIPIGTVRSRLARARSQLQRTLWDDAHDAGIRTGPPPSQRKEQPDDRD